MLWKRGSLVLGIATALPWGAFFLIAVAVLITGKGPRNGTGLDLLTGQLPSIKRTGGHRLIILGVHRNPKSSIWWRVAWSVGALLCIGSILIIYANLSSQPSIVVILWAGFQFLWLVARIIVHYFTASSDKPQMLARTALDHLSPELKGRVLNLALALGKYLTYVHPRGDAVYRQDLFSAQHLPTILLGSLSDRFPAKDTAPVTVKAVVGDTVLSAAAWTIGSKLSAMDLYDSCIVMFDHLGKTISVPGVRVLSGPRPIFAIDPENPDDPSFVPKGSPNLGYNLEWHYWIPVGDCRWIHFAIPGTGVLGKHDAELVTDAQVNVILSAGQLNISLGKAEELWAVVEASSKGAQVLQQFYEQSLEACPQ